MYTQYLYTNWASGEYSRRIDHNYYAITRYCIIIVIRARSYTIIIIGVRLRKFYHVL